jgi:hypothetical protein
MGQEARIQMVARPPEFYFPKLSVEGYDKRSDRTTSYNCIAFAAGETNRWWWPADTASGCYWPEGVPRKNEIEYFIKAFGLLGYIPCEDDTPEAGFEKLALYVDDENEPTHMARQLENGRWVSKLGNLEDIEHATLEVLEGNTNSEYGKVAQFLKRPKQPETDN